MQRILFTCLLALPLCSIGQVEYDLSKDKFTKQSIPPGTTELVLKNTLNNKVYRVNTVVAHLHQEVPPVGDLENFISTDSSTKNKAKMEEILEEILKELEIVKTGKGLTKESQVANRIAAVKAKIDLLEGSYAEKASDALNAAIAGTTIKTYLEDLGTCERIFVTITRYADAGSSSPEKIWKDTLETTCPEKPTRWFTYYGFTYQPDMISKYENYFSKQMPGTTDFFTITRKSGRQGSLWSNLSPTIMFTYVLTQKEHAFRLGLTGIATTNFSTYSAGVGLSAVIGTNLNLSSGVMFTQKHALNGQYTEGEIIKANLDFDQLHEKRWGPEIYFTIGLRFAKNPFANGGKDEPIDVAPEPKK